MNELKTIEGKLQAAEAAVSKMREELTRTEGDISRLDVTAGDLDTAVNVQVKLEAKKAILEKRITLAGEAVKTLQGDVLLAREAELSAQLAEITAKLEQAKSAARGEIGKLLRGGGLSLQQQSLVNGVVNLHREVVPLIGEAERIAARHHEAIAVCSDVRRRRSIADSREAAKMQEAIFAGNV